MPRTAKIKKCALQFYVDSFAKKNANERCSQNSDRHFAIHEKTTAATNAYPHFAGTAVCAPHGALGSYNKEMKFDSVQLQDMVALYCHLLSRSTSVSIESFPRLLPSLDVVAVSEAHMPTHPLTHPPSHPA